MGDGRHKREEEFIDLDGSIFISNWYLTPPRKINAMYYSIVGVGDMDILEPDIYLLGSQTGPLDEHEQQ